jgi:hypothetical protein
MTDDLKAQINTLEWERHNYQKEITALEIENKELREFKHMIILERSVNKVSKFQCQCWWCKLKRRFR